MKAKLQLVCSSHHPVQIHTCERRDAAFRMSHNLGTALELFLHSNCTLVLECTRQKSKLSILAVRTRQKHLGVYNVKCAHGICYIRNEQRVFRSSNQSPTCVSPCVHQIQRSRGTSWGRNHIQLAMSGPVHALRTASPH